MNLLENGNKKKLVHYFIKLIAEIENRHDECKLIFLSFFFVLKPGLELQILKGTHFKAILKGQLSAALIAQIENH